MVFSKNVKSEEDARGEPHIRGYPLRFYQPNPSQLRSGNRKCFPACQRGGKNRHGHSRPSSKRDTSVIPQICAGCRPPSDACIHDRQSGWWSVLTSQRRMGANDQGKHVPVALGGTAACPTPWLVLKGLRRVVDGTHLTCQGQNGPSWRIQTAFDALAGRRTEPGGRRVMWSCALRSLALPSASHGSKTSKPMP